MAVSRPGARTRTRTMTTISRCAGWNAPTGIVPPRLELLTEPRIPDAIGMERHVYAGLVGLVGLAGPAGPPSGGRSPRLAPQLPQNRAPAAACTPQRGQSAPVSGALA